jgi:hypothetical protein
MQRFALTALGLLALVPGCGVSNYVFRFDITEPGAHNTQRANDRDWIEDADVRVEILADPASQQDVLVDVVNKTNDMMMVDWNNVVIITPEGNQVQLRPDVMQGPIQPSARATARLITFILPTRGSAASQYDNQIFEIVIPIQVRGQLREYRYHLQAHASSI